MRLLTLRENASPVLKVMPLPGAPLISNGSLAASGAGTGSGAGGWAAGAAGAGVDAVTGSAADAVDTSARAGSSLGAAGVAPGGVPSSEAAGAFVDPGGVGASPACAQAQWGTNEPARSASGPTRYVCFGAALRWRCTRLVRSLGIDTVVLSSGRSHSRSRAAQKSQEIGAPPPAASERAPVTVMGRGIAVCGPCQVPCPSKVQSP